MKWFGRRDADLQDEIRVHIEIETQENIGRGMTPEQARRAAERTFGNVSALRETVREAKPLYWLATLLQDVRYGSRNLKRNPLLACAIVLTLAVAIGLNSGIFSLINAETFRARVDKDPDSFVRLYAQYSDRYVQGGVNLADYHAYRSGARSLSELAAYDDVWTTLGGGDPTKIRAVLVSCNFFSVYGLDRPKFGRLFLEVECSSVGAGPVAVLSEEIWRSRFGADPHILGTVIRLDRHPFTVVGVAPAHFSGRVKGASVWIPYTMLSQFEGIDMQWQWLTVEGRLKPRYSRATAQAELNVVARQQDRLQPGRKTTLIVTTGSMIARPDVRSGAFWVVGLIVGALTLVLLIACANVTTLLLSRAVARQREIAIRLSLGAGRRRLLRMLLTESLILVGAAGAISVYMAYEIPEVFKLLVMDPPTYSLKPDWVVFAYLGGITLMAGFVAGLAPAAESLKADLSASLKGQENLFGSGTGKSRLRGLLVSAQVAMSLVLLVGAGLFWRGQYQMFTADPGFETKHVLLVPLNTEMPPYTPGSSWSFYRTVEQRVLALPGVQSVSYASSSPFDLDPPAEEVMLPEEAKGTRHSVSVNIVSAGFFKTLRIPIVRGRAFQEVVSERAASEIVVSETFARRFWPGADPLGKVIEVGNDHLLEVVGVARDTKSQRYGAVDGPHFYRLRRTRSFGGSLMVRFEGDAQPIERAVGNVIRDLDREMIPAPRTLSSLIDEQASRVWPFAEMIIILGAVAAVLAVVGIYGVVTFSVSQRTRELGIRMALGATKGDIVRTVLESGIRPIVGGLVVGLLLALAGSRVLEQIFKHTELALNTADPIVFLAVSVLLAMAAVAAMFRPALRAAGADPVQTLRYE